MNDGSIRMDLVTLCSEYQDKIRKMDSSFTWSTIEQKMINLRLEPAEHVQGQINQKILLIKSIN